MIRIFSKKSVLSHRERPMSFLQKPRSKIFKSPGKGKIWVPALAVLLFFSSPVGGEDPLDVYRKAVGSPLEKRILAYARACILRVLDPDGTTPENPAGMADLPGTGMYLTLMKGRKVRACVGRFCPPSSDLARSVRVLAEEVVYHDIRTRPLSGYEMPALSLVLSFVGPRKEISDPYAVDFSTEGLYMAQMGRHAVLLPGETKTLDYGIKKLMTQIGLESGRPVRFAVFGVVAFDERKW